MKQDACNTLKTRAAFHYLKEHNRLDIYENYLRNKHEGTDGSELWRQVPEDVTDRVIKETIGEDFDAMFGPAYKGIPLATSVAGALARNYGIDKPFFFNRKEVKDHGEGGVFVGYVPKTGEEVVIVEDVITAGTAIRESMAILSGLPGVKVAATFIMVDRKERGKGEKLAMQEVEDEFGFPVYSVVDVYDIIEYLEEDPANAENVTRIKNYLAVNGANA